MCYRRTFDYLKAKGWQSQKETEEETKKDKTKEKETEEEEEEKEEEEEVATDEEETKKKQKEKGTTKKKTVYTALPNCIVWSIRRKYKEVDGKYTGLPSSKSELLKDAADVCKTFKDNMLACETIFDVANKALVENLECVELLSRLAFVSCATAFESFVNDTIGCCFDTVFFTRKVSETDEEFRSWLKSRISDSVIWTPEEREKEDDFWDDFPPTLGVKSLETTSIQKETFVLEKIDKQRIWPHIRLYLEKKPTSQETLGLVQEIINNKKRISWEHSNAPQWKAFRER